MKIILAPMDGLTDVYARELLTSIGGYDYCVTEFLRVTDTLLPSRVFLRRFPELKSNYTPISHTKDGTSIFLQLLGSDKNALAENAAKAVQLGANGIDLNFGCPAKTVNRRNGGASLLQYPDTINQLVEAVRKAVPTDIPVTAKMRLGYDNQDLAHDNALAIQEGGATWVTIHARTKKEGYRPPAHWEALSPIADLLTIPVIANGEIWSVEDYFSCRQQSGCENVMLGRGAMVTPDLARQIKATLANEPIQVLKWSSICQLLEKLYHLMLANTALKERYIAPRLKVWVKWLMPSYSEAELLFPSLKKINDPHHAIQMIKEFPSISS
ncbi:MAG: tRNA-dihydrouridine synthase [Gammaproteobacteria bacterium]|nr:tRNA-dihydrouridine synthase [Gammaproteobacteria bacterium]